MCRLRDGGAIVTSSGGDCFVRMVGMRLLFECEIVRAFDCMRNKMFTSVTGRRQSFAYFPEIIKRQCKLSSCCAPGLLKWFRVYGLAIECRLEEFLLTSWYVKLWPHQKRTITSRTHFCVLKVNGQIRSVSTVVVTLFFAHQTFRFFCQFSVNSKACSK